MQLCRHPIRQTMYQSPSQMNSMSPSLNHQRWEEQQQVPECLVVHLSLVPELFPEAFESPHLTVLTAFHCLREYLI
jgi:hypothetical protein